MTPDTIARPVANVGSGVSVGVADGVTTGVGSTEEVGVGSTEAVGVGSGVVLAEGGGSELAGGSDVSGVAVGATDGSTVATGVGLGLVVGSAMTTIESSPWALVPTTTAWFATGDCEIDFGRILISTLCESLSRTGAQSGWRSAGQTCCTLVWL